jgi:hypothetical protein
MAAGEKVLVQVRQTNGEYGDWTRRAPNNLQPTIAPAHFGVTMAVRRLPRRQASDAQAILINGVPPSEVARRRGVAKAVVSKNLAKAVGKLASRIPLAALNAASLGLSDHRHELMEKRRKHKIDLNSIVEPAPLEPGQTPKLPDNPRDLPWPLGSFVSEARRKMARLQYYVARLPQMKHPDPVREAFG